MSTPTKKNHSFIKLYTKTGDKGKTSLYDGSRLSKADHIFEVLGDIDELNSHIGLLCLHLSNSGSSVSSYVRENHRSSFFNFLRIVQYNLTNIASIIATPRKNKKLPSFDLPRQVSLLESKIDFCQSLSPPLKEFILPGGNNILCCQSHVCRSVARRLERCLFRLLPSFEFLTDEQKNIVKYINRLSDFFFSFSLWKANGSEPKVSEIKSTFLSALSTPSSSSSSSLPSENG